MKPRPPTVFTAAAAAAVLLLIAGPGGPTAARAQDEPPPPPPDGGERPPRPDPLPPPPPDGPPGRSRHGRPDRPLDQWMEHLRDRRPQEFERLQRMRERNPEELQRALRQRVAGERFKQVFEAFPELQACFQALPEERKRAFLEEAMRLAPGRDRPGDPGTHDRDLQRLEERSRELARAHRDAEGPRRAELSTELEQVLGEAFDLKEGLRKQALDRLEGEFNRLNRVVEQRRESRDAIIRRRLEELTQGEATRW